MKRMPQLDALRAFAVLGVFSNHWLPLGVAVLPWGSLGVQLFFVLSGFLITGILIEIRAKAEAGTYSFGHGLRHFYFRRFLRIFPLFYATLAVGWLMGLPNIRASLPWHALYASNFYVAFVRHSAGETAHFWTLAAEEQFYLVWPCVILFVPRRRLKAVLAALVGIAIAWRFVGAALRMDPFALQALPINTVDFFAFGAYLALLEDEGADLDRHLLFRPWLVVGALVMFLPSMVLNVIGLGEFHVGGVEVNLPVHWERIVIASASAVVFVNLIHRAARGFSGAAGRLLENPVLRYAGVISYGLYVLHLPLLAAINEGLQACGWEPLAARSWALFVPKILATFALAALSWHWFERPLNQLKRRFPY